VGGARACPTGREEETLRLRGFLVTAVALPILAGIYLATATAGLRRHPIVSRALVVMMIVAVGAVGVFQFAPKSASAYRSQPADMGALAQLAAPIVTDIRPTQAAVLAFSEPMDRASVEQVLTVEPGTAVSLRWSDTSTSVNVSPTGSWEPGTFYTITVGKGARSQAGQALARPVRSIILTRAVPTAAIVATKLSKGLAATSTAFTITFARPVDVEAVTAAFSIKPAVKGKLVAIPAGARAAKFTFTPTRALKAGAIYVITFSDPIADEDGLVVNPVPRLEVKTAAVATKASPAPAVSAVGATDVAGSAVPVATATLEATAAPDPTHTARTTADPPVEATPSPAPKVERPQVVRFRPRDGWKDVSTSQAVSVRFTKPMDHASTQAAFKLSGYDMKKGAFSWWEGDTVLVFEPDKPLLNGRKYTLSIVPGAKSKDGQPIIIGKGKRAVTAVFTVAPKPNVPGVDKPAARPTEPPAAKPTDAAPWLDIEQFALKLLNCNRTGGRILTDGTCDGYGSGKFSPYREPLKLDTSISNRVARVYAKYQAVRHACNHFLDGDPGDRMARAGFTSPHWAENIGCRPTPTRQAVINSAIFFQNEQYASYRGHWINLKNADYDRVGIGVWTSDGWVLSVYNFYRP
jgi:hypothetical protein